MINCHTHTFTIDHVPKNFLPLGLPTAMKFGLFRKPLTWLTDKLWPFSNKDQLSRLAAFIEATYQKDQITLLRELASYYPAGTKFVVLPMDMAFQGAGEVPVPLEQQLDELVAIKRSDEWGERLLPFVPADPRREGVGDLVERFVEQHGFAGVKLYPALGYWACDPRLKPVYRFCERNEVPITTHCSRGGVYFKGKLKKSPELLRHPVTGEGFKPSANREFSDRWGDPDQFRYVLEEFPNLKINFAHYGGGADWERYLLDPWTGEPTGAAARDVSVNWVHKINTLLRSDRFPNLFTDVSYTLHDERVVPLLKVFLADTKLRESVLFGTDFYMLEQDVAEREIGIKFRFWVGEDDFRLLAETNNVRFLGL